LFAKILNKQLKLKKQKKKKKKKEKKKKEAIVTWPHHFSSRRPSRVLAIAKVN